MFITFIRTNRIVAGVLTLLRLYLGFSWFMAGWVKLTGKGFDATGFIKGAISSSTGEHPAVQTWWADFLSSFALPNVELFNFLVPVGEFAVGLGLLLGCFTKTAMFFGLVMNFAFLFSGTTSTNPQLVLLGIFIIIAGTNAGKFGLDSIIGKYIHSKIPNMNRKYNQMI